MHNELKRLTSGPPLPILMYHSIVSDSQIPEGIDVSERTFRRHMALLASSGWQIAGLSKALEMRNRAEPLPSVAVTLDDGYDNAERAAEVVAEFGGTCTVYIVPSFVDRQPSVGAGKYLTWDRVRRIADGGMEIGSHAMTHLPLDVLSTANIRRELVGSRRAIEDKANVRVSSLCYPHGYWSKRVLRLARESGYSNGCGIGRTLATKEYLLALPRVQPIEQADDESFLRMLQRGETGVVPKIKRLAGPGWRVTRIVAGTVGWQLT